MAKVKLTLTRQEFIDLFEGYVKRGDSTSRSFINAMYLQLQYEAIMEYIEKCSVVDDSVYIRSDGKIANGYIQDFRHSWPFQDGGELK
jgi:hypothetical protein